MRVLFIYLLLTLGLTWPLAAHLNSRIPGEATWAFDESTFIWNMWWFKFSILNQQQTPLFSDYTFYPLGIDLTTYTFNLFNAALGLPIQLGLSLPLANNLVLIFSYVISGYGTYLLVRYLLSGLQKQGERPPHKTIIIASFLAGAVYAFSASRMMYVALGHYNFVTIQWFPFYVLCLLKTVLYTGRWPIQWMILTSLFATFCLYAELTFSVFLIFLTLFILIGLLRQANPVPFRQTVLRLSLITVLTFSLTAPLIFAVLPHFLDPAYAEPGWGEGLKLSADLVGLVTVTPLHPMSGLDWLTELRDVIAGTSRFSDANTLFLGYGSLLIAGVGVLAYWRLGRVWLYSTLTFTVLSLGPLLTINGQNRFDLDGIEVTYPLPFAALHYIPIISANRVPNRFGIPLTLCLAVLVGYGLYVLLRRVEFSRTAPVALPALTGLLLIGLLFDQYSVPIPLTSADTPTVYQQIGAEPDEFTLMQLPLGWRNSYGTLGSERTQLQYYQATHQRPMLGGNTSRNPSFKFDYYRNIPLFFALTETELYRQVDEETLARARTQASELMTLYNIKYLVIHEPLPFRLPYLDTFAATQALALDLIPHQPEPTYQSPGVMAYQVEQAEIPNPMRLDLGEWQSDPYRGAGWAGNETVFAATGNWITTPSANLFFPVQGDGDRTLRLQIAPFSYPGAPQQGVQVALNEQLLADSNHTLNEGWQEISLTLPADQLAQGTNRLTLHLAHTAAPREVLSAQRTIGQTGYQTPVDVELNSGNEFAFITVGFKADAVDASAHRRGVNVTVLASQSGEVLAQQGFDTAANEFEAQKLADFIRQRPAGEIVLLATQGANATAFFTPDTWAALQTVGLPPEPLAPPFSAIGITGAQPTTALIASGEGTAYLRLGAIPDDRTLGAAVDWVEIGE